MNRSLPLSAAFAAAALSLSWAGCATEAVEDTDIHAEADTSATVLAHSGAMPLMPASASAAIDDAHSQALLNAQDVSAQRRQPVTDLFAVAEGRWVGPCSLSFPDQSTPTLEFEMERIVAPTGIDGVYDWTIIYRSEDFGEQVRPYSMLRDGAPGRYVLDENNGILITNYLFANGIMMSEFDVPGARLTSRETFRRNRSSFEITTTSIVPELSTGTAQFPVNTSQVRSMQKCKLRRAPQ